MKRWILLVVLAVCGCKEDTGPRCPPFLVFRVDRPPVWGDYDHIHCPTRHYQDEGGRWRCDYDCDDGRGPRRYYATATDGGPTQETDAMRTDAALLLAALCVGAGCEEAPDCSAAMRESGFGRHCCVVLSNPAGECECRSYWCLTAADGGGAWGEQDGSPMPPPSVCAHTGFASRFWPRKVAAVFDGLAVALVVEGPQDEPDKVTSATVTLGSSTEIAANGWALSPGSIQLSGSGFLLEAALSDVLDLRVEVDGAPFLKRTVACPVIP